MSATAPIATIDGCARRLWDAQETRTPCAPLTTAHPELGVDDAYAIQSINVRRRMAERGLHGPPARHIGHKIGLTSLAVQRWLGVDEPDFGVLLDDMVIPEGTLAPTSALLQPRAEGEVAFVLGRDLAGPGVTVADVIRATDFIVPAIEVVDSRVAGWAVKYVDTVADNASSGMFVLGTRPTRLHDVDLALAGMTLLKNGRVESTGCGAACLGSPACAVAWLANKFGTFGRVLRAGEVILSGALGPVVPLAPGDHLELRVAHLGSTWARF